MQLRRVMLLGLVMVGLLFTSGILQTGVAQTESSAKIAPSLQTLMQSQSTIPIIVLGSDQLMSPPNGLNEFMEANAGANRLTLRTEAITQLKSIAAAQQAIILEQMPDATSIVSLWLVNAVAATVSPSTIEHLATLDDVLYIYDASGEVGAPRAESVTEIITPSEDRSFTLDGKTIPWNLTDIGAEAVWNQYQTFGEGVLVASIDVGVNYLHEDLLNNIWINEDEIGDNGLDDDGNGYIDDLYGYDFSRMSPRIGDFSTSQHGTWTSGIVLGDGTGGTLTGIAPRAQLMALRGGNSHTSFILAFEYALENEADVLTMSFSIPGLEQHRGLWRLALEHALAAGMVSVSGAGNFQQNAPHPVQLRTPEDIPSVIAVGGLDQRQNLTSFSSTGPVEWASVALYQGAEELIKPDVAAFTGPEYPLLDVRNEGYMLVHSRRGNSFSGPHAAGVSALILSAAPTLPAWRVKALMESTATDLSDPGKDNLTGAGLINALAAVEAALAEAPAE